MVAGGRGRCRAATRRRRRMRGSRGDGRHGGGRRGLVGAVLIEDGAKWGGGGGQAHECAATRSQVPGVETRSRAWCTREACCWGGVGWGRVRERAATRSRGTRGVARPQRPRGPAARPRQSGGSRGARTLLQGGRTQVAGGRACERPRSLRHGRSRRHGAASTCAWARVHSSTRSSRAGRTRRPPSGRAWGVAWAWTWGQGPHEQAQARRRRGRARQ